MSHSMVVVKVCKAQTNDFQCVCVCLRGVGVGVGGSGGWGVTFCLQLLCHSLYHACVSYFLSCIWLWSRYLCLSCVSYFLSFIMAVESLFVSVMCELLFVLYHGCGVAFCVCHV